MEYQFLMQSGDSTQSNLVTMIVAKQADLKPMSPLEGVMNVSLCFPSTSTGFISTICKKAIVFKASAIHLQVSRVHASHVIRVCLVIFSAVSRHSKG